VIWSKTACFVKQIAAFVDGEGMPPGEKEPRPFGALRPLADKSNQDLLKCAQKYRKISKSIEILRAQKTGFFTGKIRYFLRFFFFASNHRTGEVASSNPVSPLLFHQQLAAP
jgi:hypothetical protein